MQIKVLFFGATADIVRERQIELDVKAGTSPGSLIGQLSKDHPALANHKLFIAINEEYATGETVLKDGDELAIFTPVSGG